jgi:indoleamine 2,3-dioxygenase
MEYSSSYALQNYRRVQGGNTGAKLGDMSSWNTENLRLIRAFENASPSESESGFITVHVTMVAETGRIVSGAERVLEAANAKDLKAFRSAMQDLLETYRRINAKMDTMWVWSRPADYLKFRSFIFGTGPEKGEFRASIHLMINSLVKDHAKLT